MSKVIVLTFVLGLLGGCVCGSRDEYTQLLIAVMEYGYSCRDLDKPVDQCRQDIRKIAGGTK